MTIVAVLGQGPHLQGIHARLIGFAWATLLGFTEVGSLSEVTFSVCQGFLALKAKGLYLAPLVACQSQACEGPGWITAIQHCQALLTRGSE